MICFFEVMSFSEFKKVILLVEFQSGICQLVQYFTATMHDRFQSNLVCGHIVAILRAFLKFVLYFKIWE